MNREMKGKCPICGQVDTLYSSPMKRLKSHFIHAAKTELWQREWDKRTKTPHLDYLKKHYRVGVVKSLSLFFNLPVNKYIFTNK